jgi:hypothetical protein
MIGDGLLGIWFDVDAVDLDALNAWYPQEHMPERLSVPGFLRGRRYAAVGAGPGFFTCYETRDAAVLSSPAYLARLNNPTEWTRRSVTKFRHMARHAFRLLARSAGAGSEHDLLTVRIKPDSGRGPAVKEWLARDGLAAVAAVPGAGGCAFYVADAAGTSITTEERKLTGAHEQPVTPFLAVCEIAGDAGEAALREFWQAWSRMIAADAAVERYRFLYGLAWI